MAGMIQPRCAIGLLWLEKRGYVAPAPDHPRLCIQYKRPQAADSSELNEERLAWVYGFSAPPRDAPSHRPQAQLFCNFDDPDRG